MNCKGLCFYLIYVLSLVMRRVGLTSSDGDVSLKEEKETFLESPSESQVPTL